MTRAFRSALVAALLTLAGTGRSTLAATDDLSEMATRLNNLETQIAKGDGAALTQQEPLMESMAEKIQDSDPKIWSSKDDRLALISYLLGGGAPGVAAFAVSSEKFPPQDSQLIKGVLAYVLGRREEASNLLMQIDARTLDPRIAGAVAFAQSVLVAPKDFDKSIALLEVARLLAPGGLIEESSLRQEVALAAQAKDTKMFAHSLREYMIRFPRSLYAPTFIAALPEIIIDNNLVQSQPSLPLLRLGLSSMNKDLANLILIKVGREMLLDGNIVVADWTSSFVLREPALNPGQKALAEMIQGVSRAMSRLDDSGQQELDKINRAALSPADQSLLAAAKATTSQTTQDPYSGTRPKVTESDRAAIDALDGGVSDATEAALSSADSFVHATGAL